MATKTITSDKSTTKVGAQGTEITTSTRTTYNIDSNGKIDPKSVKHEIIYYEGKLGDGVVAATSTGTSNQWNNNNKPLSNTPWLGADAQKSLKEGALKNTTQQQISTSATKAGVPAEQQKALSTKQVNVASNQLGANVEQISSLADTKENDKTRNEFKGAKRSDPLKYPLTLKSKHQDVIKFNMIKYSPKSFSTQTFGFSEREKVGGSKNREIIGTVVLPIPSGISDTNAVTWGSDSMNAAQAAAANIALTSIGKGPSEGADVASNIANTISSNSGDVKTLVKNIFAESATGVTGLLSRTTGLIVNPNMELLFQGPTLRPFTFTFKLSARSNTEAEAIRSIIRFFKQGMSPIRTKSQLFLKAPHTFQIEYNHIGELHPYLNKFKECALQSFSVDYTPEGQYATFTDGAMVSYQIQMQFQELEPVFNDDYGQGAGSSGYDKEIGY